MKQIERILNLSNSLSVLICLNQYNPCHNIFLAQVTNWHFEENKIREFVTKSNET
jgi:hypothetical protein